MAFPLDLSGLDSLEQQMFVGALAMQQLELSIPEEGRPDRASIDFDTENQTVTVTFSLDTYTATVNGKAEIGVRNYLQNDG